MGYEAYRAVVLENQKRLGVVPANTELSPINPWPAPDVISEIDAIPPWDSLSDDQKRLFSRMAEVYAGFCTHADHEIGRLLDYLESSGQLDNTVIVAVSDNGASGEGGPNGSVNENKFFNNWPDDLQENLKLIDELGGPNTYNHYPAGWAWAFNTPYKMFKRYVLEGGIADPLIICWPKEMGNVAGQLRDQYHHAIDIVPTILDCVGVEPPAVLKGFTQSPIQGVSMRYTFDDATAPSRRETQYYSMLGTRAIYHQGWKVVARHGALSGKGNFNQDQWELYHTDEDRTEVHDLASENRDKMLELVALWFSEAGRNNVLPLDDRTAREQLMIERPEVTRPRTSYTYFPHTTEVPEGVAANIRNKSFTILAELHIDGADAEGVVLAQGSRFGGHALFVKGGRPYYVYNFLGIEEQKLVGGGALPTGDVRIAVEFSKTHEDPKFVANGDVALSVNDQVVANGTMRTQPGKFALSGEGLVVGRESADAVSAEYQPPFAFRGGTITRLTVDISGEHIIDEELEAIGMLARILPGHDIPAQDARTGAMSHVLKLAPFDLPGASGSPGCFRSNACTPVNSSVVTMRSPCAAGSAPPGTRYRYQRPCHQTGRRWAASANSGSGAVGDPPFNRRAAWRPEIWSTMPVW